MKIIDEKGKLFGKLNIIDLLVLILILAAVVLVVFKVTGKSGNSSSGTTFTYTVSVKGVEPKVYEGIQNCISQAQLKALPGDQLMANGAMLDGCYVTSVQSVPHEANATLSTMDGKSLVIPVNPGTLDLTFVIHAKVTNTLTNEVGTQEVRIGKYHIVKTVHFELTDGKIETIVASTGTPEG